MIRENEQGFTLIEILSVIAIVGILFIGLMPLVNNGFVKANESGVKTNFRDFQIAAEMFLRESGGKHINQNNLNVYLDKVHELKEVDNSIVTKSKDSWGKPYHVEFGDRKIIFYSTGGSEIKSKKTYVLATYYYQRTVSSCSIGFPSGNLSLKLPHLDEEFTCGENLPDVSDNLALPGVTNPLDADGDGFTEAKETYWGTDPLDPNDNPATRDIDGDGLSDYIDINNERKLTHNLSVGFYKTSTGEFATGLNWRTFKVYNATGRNFMLKHPNGGEARVVSHQNSVYKGSRKVNMHERFSIDQNTTEIAINISFTGASPNDSNPPLSTYPSLEELDLVEIWEVWNRYEP